MNIDAITPILITAGILIVLILYIGAMYYGWKERGKVTAADVFDEHYYESEIAKCKEKEARYCEKIRKQIANLEGFKEFYKNRQN